MKLLVFVAVLAVAAAAPSGYETPEVYDILKQEFELREDQSYDSHFETENGISASESGRPEEGEYGEEDSYDVNGQFSYTGDDGVVYTVVYVADDNGFQPQGEHLPTPVPTEYPTPEADDDDDDDDGDYDGRYEAPEEDDDDDDDDDEPQYRRVVVGYRPRYQ